MEFSISEISESDPNLESKMPKILNKSFAPPSDSQRIVSQIILNEPIDESSKRFLGGSPKTRRKFLSNKKKSKLNGLSDDFDRKVSHHPRVFLILFILLNFKFR